MAKVVCIHGIGQEFESRETLLKDWAPAVCGGVSNAGGRLAETDVDMAFYGALFRPSGATKSAAMIAGGVPEYAPGDVEDPLEIQMLQDLYQGVDSTAGSTAPTKFAGERGVASMLQTLARVPFFGAQAQSVVIWFLKQVRRYVSEAPIRQGAQRALLDAIRDNTRVVVAHSLGSVVAYEVLCAQPQLPVRTLVTIGSPLGMSALLDRLMPPAKPGPAQWPQGIATWVNIADGTDAVALEKKLASIYGARLIDHLVHNGATMHNSKPYLTAKETGAAVLAGLA